MIRMQDNQNVFVLFMKSVIATTTLKNNFEMGGKAENAYTLRQSNSTRGQCTLKVSYICVPGAMYKIASDNNVSNSKKNKLGINTKVPS